MFVQPNTWVRFSGALVVLLTVLWYVNSPIKQDDLGRRQLFHQSVLAQAGFNERKQIPEIGHNNIGLVWVLGRCGKNLR
jgi:hypothetical protein